jgi:hypothetical protein
LRFIRRAEKHELCRRHGSPRCVHVCDIIRLMRCGEIAARTRVDARWSMKMKFVMESRASAHNGRNDLGRGNAARET